MRCSLQRLAISTLLFGALNSTISSQRKDSRELVKNYVSDLVGYAVNGVSVTSFFHPNMSFKGCIGTFNNTQVVTFFSSLEGVPKPVYYVISSYYTDVNTIRVHASIAPERGETIETIFYLTYDETRLVMISGRILDCAHNLIGIEDGSKFVVH
uniref:NTF2-like domain-containing protein n=1 Tax=Caenorhabditis japonica TaxID=281687 RepID=A0A8R1HVT8_CAEJA